MALVEVIKYDGNPNVFAWKYPDSELGTWTQLIVNESQEAILVKGGQICDIFQAGRHTLSTENIPILNKLVNLPFGGRSPFSAEVWFINKTFHLDVKWGTTSPIQIQDPKYKVFVPVRAFGQFGVQIEESKKFLMKLVGTLPEFNKDTLLKFFRGVYLTKAKDAISSYFVHKNVSVLEINAYLDEISSYLQQRMMPVFQMYGISLTSFYVNDINVPENDEAVKRLKDALAKRAEMDIVGYDYQQERSFDTLEGAATNQGSLQSALMSSGLGLGMGFGLGGMFGNEFGGLTQQIRTTRVLKKCPKCNSMLEKEDRFCNHCGYDTMTPEKKEVKITCASCGTLLQKDSKFCRECGKKYNPCSNCGADMPEDSNVCPSCGTATGKVCPGCGKVLTADSKFCPECGYSLQKKCTGCGKAIEGNTKFCPECGMAVK